jgi:ABC-type branched-subunit amino acid transport system ATPase component
MSVAQLQSIFHLQIKNLSHLYGNKLALQNVSLNVTASEILALLGPSGSGKSTLLAAIAGIVKPEDGEIRELVGSVLLRPPGMQTVSTFILREFDQGSPAAGMAMGTIAIAAALLSITLARRLVGRNLR